MRRSVAKEKRSDGRISNIASRTSNIATFDNGTMVETFKFLNYCQLAKNSLVSQRYRDLIRTNRHRLALLYVDEIRMSKFHTSSSFIIVFDKELLPEAYNEWVIRNGYSKQIPIEDQVIGKQCAQYGNEEYVLRATAFYKDPNSCQSSGSTTAFLALIKLNHKHWPLFQHFVRLLMDPFIYIRHMRLTPQKDFVNLLAGAFNQDRGRLRCEMLKFDLECNVPKFINWAKNNTFCDKILIDDDIAPNQDEELLDLLVTGAQCTPVITTGYYDSSKVIVDFVQKFMDLKSSDGRQMVESIRGEIEGREVIEVLKRDYAGSVVKEEMDQDDDITKHVFEFVNSDVGKKLQLSLKFLDDDEFEMTINNL